MEKSHDHLSTKTPFFYISQLMILDPADMPFNASKLFSFDFMTQRNDTQSRW